MVLCLVAAGCVAPTGAEPLQQAVKSAPTDFDDSSGRFSTVVASGALDESGPFFQSLGQNGRACATCHAPEDGWTITPAHLQARFDATQGTDPVFRLVDGAISPAADVSTVDARRGAYALLLSKGLIRIELPVPATADYDVVGIDDPYGVSTPQRISVYRRPLPATNLRFLTTVMWDGRESPKGRTLNSSLLSQAMDATQGHAQAIVPLAGDVAQQIVDFELGLTTAQSVDSLAQNLTARHGNGGPAQLAAQAFYPGINDPLGGDFGPGPTPLPSPLPADPQSMTLYAAWNGAPGGGADGARAAIARGEALFGGKRIFISGVRGLNDTTGVDPIPGTCSTCHDSPNAGSHSLALPIDIGVTAASRRTRDLPLFTLREKSTGAVLQTTDPGRALITGLYADASKMKGPTLRALAARPPYFHDGSAATLDDVVDFYDQRFGIGFSAQEKSDLVAFLKAL